MVLFCTYVLLALMADAATQTGETDSPGRLLCCRPLQGMRLPTPPQGVLLVLVHWRMAYSRDVVPQTSDYNDLILSEYFCCISAK